MKQLLNYQKILIIVLKVDAKRNVRLEWIVVIRVRVIVMLMLLVDLIKLVMIM